MILAFTLPTITLGPAALSMPELAQALTRAGMPTEASPALRERGAYVRLKDRSPEAVRRLLGEALDVAFRPGGARWTMVVDPAARERDRLLLIGYKRVAVGAAGAWAKEEDRLRGGRSYVALRAWADGQVPLIAAFPKGDPQAPRVVKDVTGAYMALSPSAWLGLSAMRDSGLVAASLGGAQAWTVSREEAERCLGLPLAQAWPKSGGAIQGFDASLGYDIDRGVLRLGARAVLPEGQFDGEAPWRINAGGWGISGYLSGETEIRVEASTLEETFTRMGPTARATLDRFVAAKSLPNEPLGKDAASRSLSHLLERLDLDAVMELSPRFEEARTTTVAGPYTLRQALSVVESPPETYPRMPDWLAAILPPTPWSLETRARAFPWRAVEREGAWLVVDPIAFLDRLRPLSPVPYLLAERILQGLPKDAPRSGGFSDPLPDWRTVERIGRAVPPDARLDRYGYRGVGGGSLGLLPVARFMDAEVPPAQRAALWKAAFDPAGARWETAAGVLTLTAMRLQVELSTAPVATVQGRWRGRDGSTWVGVGDIDARGLGG